MIENRVDVTQLVGEISPLRDDIAEREEVERTRKEENTKVYNEALEFIREVGHTEPVPGEQVTEQKEGESGYSIQRAVPALRLTTPVIPLPVGSPDDAQHSFVIRTSITNGLGHLVNPESISMIMITRQGDNPPVERTLFRLGEKESTDHLGKTPQTPDYRIPRGIIKAMSGLKESSHSFPKAK